MKITTVEMFSLAESALREILSTCPERAVETKVDKLPSIPGDRSLLRQVFVNLIGNAVKYTRPRAVARIEIGYREEGKEIVYFIRDNGVGFSMEYVHKLFGVFQRLHAHEEFEGTGVGLALVGRIIQRHGGRVWAEGKPDEGAVFHFALPKGGRHEQLG